VSAQRSETFKDISTQPKEWGRMVESAIGAHLINHSLTEGFKVHYWRERNEEIDFVIEKNKRVIGVEVKSSATKTSKGIAAFKKKFGPNKVLLIGDAGFSWQHFLLMNPMELF
jgi:predicted AAA+ superfamily ATPase